MKANNTQSKGFTIVELLIVVVVIAILAAITIVGYNGVTSRARQATMQAGLDQTATQLSLYRTLNGEYPANLSALNNGQGPDINGDYELRYTIEGEDYCMSVLMDGSDDAFYVCGNTGRIESGIYATHVSMVAGFPTRGGYIDMSGVYEAGVSAIPVDIGSIPTGSWMIVVLTYNNPADATPPPGWSALYPRKATGSLQTCIFAKIKESGDGTLQVFSGPGTNSGPYTNGVLFWGGGSSPINTWTLGSFGDRAVNATPTTVVTPTVTVPVANSLVISIATERTTAAEANYTSLTGATPWIWIPQPDSNKIQPIAVGYNEQASPGMSQAMTVTYPNSQSSNGTGVQIVIPPAG